MLELSVAVFFSEQYNKYFAEIHAQLKQVNIDYVFWVEVLYDEVEPSAVSSSGRSSVRRRTSWCGARA